MALIRDCWTGRGISDKYNRNKLHFQQPDRMDVLRYFMRFKKPLTLLLSDTMKGGQHEQQQCFFGIPEKNLRRL